MKPNDEKNVVSNIGISAQKSKVLNRPSYIKDRPITFMLKHIQRTVQFFFNFMVSAIKMPSGKHSQILEPEL